MRLQITYLLSLIAGIVIASVLIAYTSMFTVHTKITHWKLELFSPVKQLFKKFSSEIQSYPKSMIYKISNHNTTVSIYLLLPGKSIRELPNSLKQLTKYMRNTSIIALPVGMNKDELLKSSALLCVLTRYRLSLQNMTMLRMLINEVMTNTSLVLDRYTECKKIISSTNLTKVIYLCKRILNSIIMYGLLNKTVASKLFYYVENRLEGTPPIIYVVCNTNHDVCVAATVSELSIVYRNVEIEVPFGYG